MCLFAGWSDDEQALTSFSINGIEGEFKKPVDESVSFDFEIKIEFPYEIDLENLIPLFTISGDAFVFVNNTRQKSGVTANDFTEPVIYSIKKNNNVVETYRVQISFLPEFRLDIGANFHPSYNITYSMVNIGTDGDIFIGGKFNDILIGLNIMESYFIFNGQSNGVNISGYWNILRGTFDNRINISKFWELEWKLGASWLVSQFDYNNINRYTRNNPGVFGEFAISLLPWKYVRLDLINQFDLFMNVENGNPFESIENFYPYYRGKVRINFQNFIKWFRIHVAVSWLWSYYSKDNINTIIGMATFEAGIHFDLQFPALTSGYSPDFPQYVEKLAGSGIESLKNAKKNDMIDFPDITFKKDSDDLTEESVITVGKIADLLKEKVFMEIGIKIYSQKGDDPVLLLRGSLRKAIVIRKLLTDLGIDETRVQIPSEVFILPEEYTERELLIRITILKL